MSKYLKKCLIIYTSLALILVGMAGATYAITATDADQYVTRSEYSVDMSYIQLKLDEKESSLLGIINKYRSTDIKLTTFDTPWEAISSQEKRRIHLPNKHIHMVFMAVCIIEEH